MSRITQEDLPWMNVEAKIVSKQLLSLSEEPIEKEYWLDISVSGVLVSSIQGSSFEDCKSMALPENIMDVVITKTDSCECGHIIDMLQFDEYRYLFYGETRIAVDTL